MSLYKQIYDDMFQAKKDRHILKANLLNSLYGDAKKKVIDTRVAELSDEEVTAIIKKYLASNQENKSLLERYTGDGKAEKLAECDEERTILEHYLPKQLGEAELSAAIDAILSELSDKSIGAVMKSLKTHYAGQYDGKLASTLINAKLS